MRRALLIVLAAACAGCVSLGKSFPSGPIAGLKIGATTRSDVETAFGRPYRTGVEDGDETWTYLNYRFSVFAPESAKDLYVRFDAAGKVKSYSYNVN